MPDPTPKASWIPLPHFMALAPLDVWLRLLMRRFMIPRLRYIPRLALGLATSFVGTAVTLPERLLLGPYLWTRFRKPQPMLDHDPGILVITGYYRSGTTHLHYLLSCDPSMTTPRWAQVSAPHGFILSWLLIRIFMIPFVSNSRPQDDVAFGPEWPSEDDFALNNAALASSLPGRFIVPSQYDHYERFNSLERLNDRERQRWRYHQAAFCWKLLALAPRKRLLLKTPSHTARLNELHALFGDRLRVIHISRDPDAVVCSNVRMAANLEPYSLEPMPTPQVIRDRVIKEYVESEALHTAQAETLGADRVASLRFEDLIADPLGQLRRCYDQLGLPWSEDAESRFCRYLGTVRGYKPRHGANKDKSKLEPELAALARQFGHDLPPIEPVAIEHPPVEAMREGRAIVATWITAAFLAGFWMLWAHLLNDRTDPLMWIFGILLGLVAVRTAGRGSRRLGILTALAHLTLLAGTVVPATYLAYHHQWADHQWHHALLGARKSMTATNNMLFIIFGLISAYRVATRVHVRPPGT